ncbi:exo-alpha-sialidase [Aquirufa sp.]|jgi:predicted neuraminidase|uniref:exo-alpha-sialidase n=1 Tax=Aquirufa sp. TaxID=2676249 RepID=UPI0037BE3386
MKKLFYLCLFSMAFFVAHGQKIQSAAFIYESAPFPSCHASTLVETPQGIVAAWFGGTYEKHPDVAIWLSYFQNDTWSKPVEVANGIQGNGKRYPLWNPVLFQMPGKELILFYKDGPAPDEWWGMLKRSFDGGKTWSAAERLPKDIYGPIKNKPELLADGTLICPSSSEDHDWRLHMEFTKDGGKTWSRTEALNDGVTTSAIQPSILKLPDGKLQLVCRSENDFVLQSISADQGKSWSALKPTTLLNPNSGIDAVTLKDGRHIIIYNNTKKGRSPLNVAISSDGQNWKDVAVLENEPNGEFSYPAVIQAADGKVHITYTWKRKKIKHVVMTL